MYIGMATCYVSLIYIASIVNSINIKMGGGVKSLGPKSPKGVRHIACRGDGGCSLKTTLNILIVRCPLGYLYPFLGLHTEARSLGLPSPAPGLA